MEMSVKQMQPPEGKALMYFVRPSGRGGRYYVKIICDGKYIGRMKGKQFLYTILDLGNHTIFSDNGGEHGSSFSGVSELNLRVEAGKTYFLHVIIMWQTGYFDNKLIQIVESNGRVLLNKCELSTDTDIRDLY